jgi:UV DNA damage endonuclease
MLLHRIYILDFCERIILLYLIWERIFMRIGYACIPLGINAKTTRRVSLKSYTEARILDAIKENLIDLEKILEYNKSHNISLFRISSDIIPLGSHSVNNVLWYEHFNRELRNIGKFINDNGMRVSMHPGQYTVLNSENEETVSKAVKDLEYHTSFLDALEVDGSHKIILHVGGVYGHKQNAIKRFIDNYRKLPKSIKNRLVIENDEKNYSIDDVLKISEKAQIPVVFDNLHNECHRDKNINIDEIMEKVNKTWREKDGPIKVHYSQQDKTKKTGAHSKTINVKEFLEYHKQIKQYKPDIMLEVKDKNISAVKCNYVVEELSGSYKKSIIYDQWAKYKYVLMERNYKYYKQCSKMVKEGCTFSEFYNYIDEILKIEGDKGNFIDAAEHVWGYVKKNASQREKTHFRKVIGNLEDKNKVKDYLQKLCIKYSSEYMMKSYYFYY